ncbi:hypothetical protein [Mammaliicoccus sp. P-M58]|uniref:hypothetical protein n=1 Tax=Mammaliicoccus sp. P-M58 TaxID=2898717 RepID=UPI001EFB1887|nr:hypothetical protein [Mammaliicoccus sp. P-M58]
MKKLIVLLFATLLVLGACGQKVESKDLIKGFEKAGLSVKNEKKMTHEDFGIGPYKTKDARVFNVEDDKNGRVFVYDNEKDLKEMKEYYDKMSEESAMLYSHTYAKDKVLIQMNGEIKKKTFDKYTKTIEKVLNGDKITTFKEDKKKVASKEKTDKKDKSEDNKADKEQVTDETQDNVTVNEDEQNSIEPNQEVVSNEQTSPKQNADSNNQSSSKQEGINKEEYDRTKTTTHDESQVGNPEYEQYKQAQQFTQELEQGKHQNGVGGGPGMTSPTGESFNDYQSRVQQERDALTVPE